MRMRNDAGEQSMLQQAQHAASAASTVNNAHDMCEIYLIRLVNHGLILMHVKIKRHAAATAVGLGLAHRKLHLESRLHIITYSVTILCCRPLARPST